MYNINYGFLVFVVCLSCSFAGQYPHVPMGHGMHGGSYGNQGLHGSTLQNFYPGDWSNQRVGSYQYFDSDNFPWNSNMQGGTGNLDWSQSGGNWNQPHMNTWSSLNGNQGWNNGMNNVNGWNNNLNSGWAGAGGNGLNGWGNNWNNNMNNGWNNNGLSGNGWNSNGWNNNGFGNNWNNGWNGNGWNNNGLGNNWNNNWNNNMNSGWTVPDGLALQSH